MRRYDRLRVIALLALIAALALGAASAALAEEEAPGYTENEWNFVDGSMSVTAGIPEDAEGVLARVRDTGVLRVATEPYFPPQEFIDPDLEGQERYAGSDMKLARRIAERMGVALEIVPMEFTEVLDAVADGTCDLAISALSYTPGRAALVTMSKGYYFAEDNAGSVLLIRAEDADAIHGVDDLAGRDIVAQSGSLQETLMAQNAFSYHEFRRLPAMQDVYAALEKGRADAAMVDYDTARLYIKNNPGCGLALVEEARFKQEAQFDGDRVAAKRGEFQLMYFVNGVIDEVLGSGEYMDWFAEAEARAATLEL